MDVSSPNKPQKKGTEQPSQWDVLEIHHLATTTVCCTHSNKSLLSTLGPLLLHSQPVWLIRCRQWYGRVWDPETVPQYRVDTQTLGPSISLFPVLAALRRCGLEGGGDLEVVSAFKGPLDLCCVLQPDKKQSSGSRKINNRASSMST